MHVFDLATIAVLYGYRVIQELVLDETVKAAAGASRRGLGAVDPDVLGLIAHVMLLWLLVFRTGHDPPGR